MFQRKLLKDLQGWRNKAKRKPLVIRGARQVGKTTLVNQFAKSFDQYIYLNLELENDRRPFEQFTTIEQLVQALFFLKNKSLANGKSTLIFIDEIQEVPNALNQLRYFYESYPEIAVIAAGSLLETLFDKDVHFPVGRVEYMVLRPASFEEFLSSIGETAALEEIKKIPAAPFIHHKLLDLFHTYALIGGMPEIIQEYAIHKDLTALAPIYESLITSYQDDVEKYASGTAQLTHIRHALRSAFYGAGKRIKFEGFGNSNYRSREMSEALRTLEQAMLLNLIHPTTSYTLPISPDLKKSPRLQLLDTGLLNYFVGIQKEIIGTKDLSDVYRGMMIEHLVGQELLTLKPSVLNQLIFWVREKNTSSAEIDFLFTYNSKIIPIEVKSGSTGKLKSLQQFMDLVPHDMSIRFYSGELNITVAKTPSGKQFRLLSLPYYLVSELEGYLGWMGDGNG